MEKLRSRLRDAIAASQLRERPEQVAHQRLAAERREHARAVLAEARRCYLRFEFAEARRSMTDALAAALTLVSWDGPLVAEALRLQAQIELASGHEDVAREIAGMVAALDSEGPRLGSMPPAYAQLEASARAAANASVPVRVTVRSVPEGAQISVDGRSAGAAPAIVDVAPGMHVFRAELPSFEVAAGVRVVQPDQPIDLVLRPDPDAHVLLQRIADGTVDVGDVRWRAPLLRIAGATHLLSIAGGPAALTARLEDGTTPARTLGGPANADAIAERVAVALTAGNTVNAPRPGLLIAEPKSPPRASSSTRKWVIWTAIGAAVSVATIIVWASVTTERVHICTASCP